MANIAGTNGPETLIGGPTTDTIDAMGGDDILTGGGGADILTGGFGADIFRDTAAGLAGDRITDFSPGDRIQLTDLTLANANIQIIGTTLSYNGGSIQIDGLSAGRYVIRAIANNGGVEVRFQPNARNDFDGDGRSDILWRNDNGNMTNWLGLSNGGFHDNAANAFTNVPTSWHIGGTGDFNGDGRNDILWRNDNGDLTNWLGLGNGGFQDNAANGYTNVPTSWHVAATGDFNGDGRDDILWRNDNGNMTNWLGLPNGGFQDNAANGFTFVPNSWHVAATGDFNGDGRADILWRNDNGNMTNWLGLPNGGFQDNAANSFTFVPTSWHVAGTGDFNGDGRADILWRNDNGNMSDWLGLPNGGFQDNAANAFTNVPTTWHIAGTGDFNGDAIDDILWRTDEGSMSDWLGLANGGFHDNAATASTNVPTSWHMQPTDPFF